VPAGGGLSNAWRYGWTRIATVTVAVATTVLVLTQAPWLAVHLVSDRWLASMATMSVQALGVTVPVFLAAGTVVTFSGFVSPTSVESDDEG
jgi:hypothetical protein